MTAVRTRIREFIFENFLFEADDSLTDSTSFLDGGIIDSTGLLELVAFVEQEFDIVIEDDELVPENLDSINNIHDYLARKNAP